MDQKLFEMNENKPYLVEKFRWKSNEARKGEIHKKKSKIAIQMTPKWNKNLIQIEYK